MGADIYPFENNVLKKKFFQHHTSTNFANVLKKPILTAPMVLAFTVFFQHIIIKLAKKVNNSTTGAKKFSFSAHLVLGQIIQRNKLNN